MAVALFYVTFTLAIFTVAGAIADFLEMFMW